MPANLPPQAKAAERRYIEAKTLPEKIKYLQEFISSIPEHKGNEKMRGYLRRRLAQLKAELEEQKKRKVGGGGGGFAVKKEGAAQIVILGMTGAGKSSLLMRVTNAKTEVSDHQFTTKEPVPGMMKYEDIQFQLVDTPAIYEGMEEGAWGAQVLSLARNADGLLLLLDGGDAPSQFVKILKALTDAGITIDRKTNRVEIEVTNGGGIQIMSMGRMSCSVEDVKKMLRESGVRNASIRVWGDVTLRDFEEALEQTRVYKPSLIVINKVDLYPSAVEEFRKATGREAIGISTLTGEGIANLGKVLFKTLGIMRIYTKEPSGEIAEKPIIVPTGTKVLDIAKIVHSHLYKNFKYARVWGESVNYDGERVGGEHELADKDIVEIRVK
ncbi:MAG: 50S ribosome-binding GTPase [Candidatus Methanomethyliaceae archaeon]|nr:50S ribosome-binding GTPase [Candidatus Methanomethyliaceae archaeon]